MLDQIILSWGIALGIIGFLLGFFMSFRSYIRTKSLIESQIAQAEEELKIDLREVSSMELVRTQSGQQLNFILQREYAERLNRPSEYTIFEFGNVSFIVKSKFRVLFSMLLDLIMLLGSISSEQTGVEPVDRRKDQ